MIKFQYVSDIHLEHCKHYEIEQVAEYLLMAGDIGYPHEPSYVDLLEDVSKKFTKVFVIMGNHEYWERPAQEVKTQIKNLGEQFPNIIFLDNTSYQIAPNLSIFGTTLWSSIKNEELIAKHVWDFRKIPGFTPKEATSLHRQAREAFQTHLAESPPNHKWIVLCHHIPHTSLIDKAYIGNPMNEAYATDVDEFQDDRVHVVVYGHTHKPSISTKYYCNPIGYPGQNSEATAKKTFQIEI
jgi:predicted phosphohydrolase